MATTTTCTRQENNINALGSLDNAGMPSSLGDTPQNIKEKVLIIILRPLYKWPLRLCFFNLTCLELSLNTYRYRAKKPAYKNQRRQLLH